MDYRQYLTPEQLDEWYKQQQKADNRVGLLGALESAAAVGSGAVAEPLAGLFGLTGLAFTQNPEAAAAAVDKARNALTYTPRTEGGQAALQNVGNALAPIGNLIEGAQTGAGDYVFDKTGSPLLGALTQAAVGGAPDIAGGLLGAKALPKGQSYTIGDIGTQASKFGGKQRGVFASINAEGAPVEQYMRAQQMLDEGVSPRNIWTETAKTGEPIRVDKAGNLTHEISDQGAVLKPAFWDMVNSGDKGQVRLADILGHEDLYAGYPDIASTRFSLLDEAGTAGSFSDIRNLIQVNPKSGMKTMRTDPEILSTLIHEIQHKIQSVEELPRGGSVSIGASIAEDADRAYKAGMDKRQGLLDQIADIENKAGYKEKGGLLGTSRQLDEIARLQGYLDDYNRGGKLTDKRRHIFNSGSSVMDYNDEYRMRMGIDWPKKHRPQSERDAAYAEYIRNALDSAKSQLDQNMVEQVGLLGVKNPTQKLSRDITNINKKTRPIAMEANDVLNTSNQAFQFGGGAIPQRAVYGKDGKFYVTALTDDQWNPKPFDTMEQAYDAAREIYAGGANYKALSGEVEARLAQERMKYAKDQMASMNPFVDPVMRSYPADKQISLGRDYTLGSENEWIKLLGGLLD